MPLIQTLVLVYPKFDYLKFSHNIRRITHNNVQKDSCLYQLSTLVFEIVIMLNKGNSSVINIFTTLLDLF